jgi:hypothetical protein
MQDQHEKESPSKSEPPAVVKPINGKTENKDESKERVLSVIFFKAGVDKFRIKMREK